MNKFSIGNITPKLPHRTRRSDAELSHYAATRGTEMPQMNFPTYKNVEQFCLHVYLEEEINPCASIVSVKQI